MKKGQLGGGVLGKIMLIVAVPILIIVGLLIFSHFSASTRTNSALNEEVLNESMGNISTAPSLYTVSDASNSDFVELTDVTCYNGTANTGTLSCNINDATAGKVNVTEADADSGDEYLDYDYLGGKAGTALEGTTDNTYSGFNLASVLPIVVAGLAVLGLVVGMFAGL